MSVLAVSIQLCTVEFSQCSKARKGIQIRKKEGKLSVLNDIITYVENPMKSTKKATKTNRM